MISVVRPQAALPNQIKYQQENKRGSLIRPISLMGSAENPKIVVVGSGLAGSVAALTAADSHTEVVLLEKHSCLGGNSKKASSGISAVTVCHGDSCHSFAQDILKSGGGYSRPELVNALAVDSENAIKYLEEKTGLDLTSSVVQLGGHTKCRTHTDAHGPIGFDLMRALEQKITEHPYITPMLNSKVVSFMPDAEGTGVGGVIYENTETTSQSEVQSHAVVLCSGGFGANAMLLREFAGPEIASLPSTNGPWATGDLIKPACDTFKAALVDCDKVQVHPTGFVDPANPDARTKFLAGEKLRGVGGILLNKDGRRFVDELSTRDVVSGAMQKQPGKNAFLLLDAIAAESFGAGMKFYVTKGFFTKCADCGEVAAKIGVKKDVIEAEMQQYKQAAMSGESDVFGKRLFPPDGRGLCLEGPFYVAEVTPVVHYCMGGLLIDEHSQVLTADGIPIHGLYAAGEVAGGLHGTNRLAGTSLLECTVFGRRAGMYASNQAKWSLSHAH